MALPSGHRKRVKHYHTPGDCHELTFSCYQRRQLLTSYDRLCLLSRCIDRAMESVQFRLIAFVFMPEHVHLIVYPVASGNAEIGSLLKSVKQPYSRRIKEDLSAAGDPSLRQLTVRERPGRQAFRFWQEGGGYDRNLCTSEAVLTSMDYIHLNPVQRQLCESAGEWKWSSYRHYHDMVASDPDLPIVHGLPAEFLM